MKKMSSGKPPGVAPVIVAEFVKDMVVLGGATEGEAETPPVSAKAAGRKVPKMRKNEVAVKIEITKPFPSVLNGKASYGRFPAQIYSP